MTLGNSQVILLTVSEFAKICGTTPRTIRFYEKLGLFKPKKIDSWNKYHYYDSIQARDVLKIKLLQKFGVPLKQIVSLLRKNEANLSLSSQIIKLKDEIKEKLEEYKFLKSINLLLYNKGDFKNNLKEEFIGPFKLFCQRFNKGDYYKINDYILLLRKVADNLGIKYSDSDFTFYYDDKYQPKDTDIEVALICRKIPKRLDLPKGFYLKDLPKTNCLIFSFTGPYNYLSLAHKKFEAYVEEKGINVKGSVFEHYVKNPLHTDSPYNYLTKICYPI